MESLFLSLEDFAIYPPPAESLGARFRAFTEGVLVDNIPMDNLAFSAGGTLFATVVRHQHRSRLYIRLIKEQLVQHCDSQRSTTVGNARDIAHFVFSHLGVPPEVFLSGEKAAEQRKNEDAIAKCLFWDETSRDANAFPDTFFPCGFPDLKRDDKKFLFVPALPQVRLTIHVIRNDLLHVLDCQGHSVWSTGGYEEHNRRNVSCW